MYRNEWVHRNVSKQRKWKNYQCSYLLGLSNFHLSILFLPAGTFSWRTWKKSTQSQSSKSLHPIDGMLHYSRVSPKISLAKTRRTSSCWFKVTLPVSLSLSLSLSLSFSFSHTKSIFGHSVWLKWLLLNTYPFLFQYHSMQRPFNLVFELCKRELECFSFFFFSLLPFGVCSSSPWQNHLTVRRI